MKILKKLAILLFCLCMFQTTALSTITAPVQAEAAAKRGLQKEGSNYYFYNLKGQKVTNTWKTIKTTVDGKTVYNKYYFGPKGAAYKAPANKYSKYHITFKKINGKYYGFDKFGVMAKGVRTNLAGTIYVFDNKGNYNKTKTTTLRSAAKKANITKMISLLGKYQKIRKGSSCSPFGDIDVMYLYDYVMLSYVHDSKSNKDTFLEIYTR